LAYRNFRLFFAGQLLSLTGTWMQNVAQAWLVYRLTGSALLLGTVGFAGHIPVFLLAPIGGAVADRHSRHRVIITTQICAMLLAFILATLTLTGYVQIWHVVVLAGLLGTVNAFDIPARQSFFVEMVGKEDLLNAIALNSTMFNAARIVGPAVAGIVVASIGEGWCFLVNGVSYLAVIGGLLSMRVERVRRLQPRVPVLAELLEGVHFVRGAEPVRVLLLMLGLVSLVGTPYVVLMPLFADKVLHGGAADLGLLMGASGIGAIVGALGVAAQTNVRGLGRVVGWACAGFGAGLILFSLSRWMWVSFALLIPVGYFLMTQMACSNTLIQSIVPDHIRGRVMALYSVMFLGMAPFGALLSGAVAQRLGAPAAVCAGGVICIAAAVLYARRLPAIHEQARDWVVAPSVSVDEAPPPLPPRGA
jgi:MFS family permease